MNDVLTGLRGRMGSFPSLRRQWIAASETQRIERILAATRALLAIASLFVIWIDPTEPSHYATIVYALLAIFMFEAIGVLALVRTQRNSSATFRVAVHAIDILWPALIAIFTSRYSILIFTANRRATVGRFIRREKDCERCALVYLAADL